MKSYERAASMAPQYSTPADTTTPQLPGPPLSRAPFAIAIFCAILATLSVLLRVISRRLKGVSLGAEDHVIFAALPCVYVMCTGVLLEVLLGAAGRPTASIYPERAQSLVKILLVLQMFFALSLGLIKVSICIFYMRVFPFSKFRKSALGVMIFCICWALMTILIGFCICRPLAYNWDMTIPGGSCADQNAAYVAVGGVDIATDLSVLVLPLPMIRKLQMPRITKIGLVGLFSLGLLTIAISALRMYTLAQVDYNNITETTAQPFLWSVLEPSVGILVACVPMCHSLFGIVAGKLRGSSAKETYGPPNRNQFARVGGRDIRLQQIGDKHLGIAPSTTFTASSGKDYRDGTLTSIDYGAKGYNRSSEIHVATDIIVEASSIDPRV